MIRLFFLIRSLERGGAERQLLELVRELVQRRFDVTVCTFYDGGALRPDLERLRGVQILSLGKRGRWDVIRFLWRLLRAVQLAHPDIIHGYMPIANELSLLMAHLSDAACVWGIRASVLDYSHYDWLSRCAFRFGAFWSRFADAIIVNSEGGRNYHISSGYHPDCMAVIPNGIDCDRFFPNVDDRTRVRLEFGIGPTQRLIGIVGRLDPVKDHQTFFSAAAIVAKRHQNARFACVGGGPADYTERLVAQANALGLDLVWVGAREDMNPVYNALDVLVLSSLGEGFPNVVGEAMAAGKLCVVTRVGDAETIVGDAGRVVPPRDPGALAAGIDQLLALDDQALLALGTKARARIVTRFSRERLGAATESLLRNVAIASKAGHTQSVASSMRDSF